MKRGQVSLFLVLGIMFIFVVIIFFAFINRDSGNVNDGLVVVENIEDAKETIEDCVQESVEDGFYLMGLQGGYLDLPAESSSFGTVYELVTVPMMTTNLEEHLENEIVECHYLLDDSGFTWSGGKPMVEVLFLEEAEIAVSNLGMISDGDVQRELGDQTEYFAVDLREVYSVVDEITESDAGIKIVSYDNYVIQPFVYSEDYYEMIVEVTEIETEFQFRVARLLF
ncbi:hypothetical protein HOE91_00890 [archaeon]|jgi:hypothetical protein|nr:hypothetical protein [archaeon]